MKVYLGTHRPTWLALPGPALMVSLNTLPNHPAWRAQVPWFLDSGGFTELQKYGRWRTTADQHIIRSRHAMKIGRLVYASPQDWMCEPIVINGGTTPTGLKFAGTGLSVLEHQQRTVANLLDLRRFGADVPWVPVLQGFTIDEYHHCADMYEAAGVRLVDEPLIGLGSVCRRQAMGEATEIVQSLAQRGYRLHGFGFKQDGIEACWPWLESVDSMAWSYNARAEGRKGVTCGRPNGRGGTVKSCGNCRHYALEWLARTESRVAPLQGSLLAELRSYERTNSDRLVPAVMQPADTDQR